MVKDFTLKRHKMDIKDMVFNAAMDGRLRRLKLFLNGKSAEEISSLISARTNGTTPLVIACKNGHIDVAAYLLQRCKADIEQVGSVTVKEEVIDDTPPLWCATAAGHLNIVKMLLKYNASVNTAEAGENMTVLYAACSYGRFDIAKYLIQQGADIEITNKFGATCLMAACMNRHYKISKYLLERGADIHRKCKKGYTALHICAETGRLDLLKLLLRFGAKSVCDSYGITPLLKAAFFGHSNVVEYFLREFNCTKQEQINAFEVLGSLFMREDGDMVNAFECWKRAMMLRTEGNEFPLEEPTTRSPLASCVNATEVRNLYQLEEINSDLDKMMVQALLIIERMFGPGHRYTVFYILRNGERYSDNGNFPKCVRLWMHGLDVQLKVQDSLNLETLRFLEAFAELFSSMISEGWTFERDIESVSFRDILHVFKESVRKIETDLHAPTAEKDNYYTKHFHRTLIISIHLIGMMCRLQPYQNIYENTELKKASYELVHLNPKGINGCTLLHLACCRDSSFIDWSFSSITFPSPEVVELLLEVGASVNSVDAANNTPLHLAAMNMPCAPAVFKSLVKHGAHLDLRNYEGKTPLQLAEIMLFLDDYPRHYINLQCLCAQAIRKYKITYEGFIENNLKEFLDSH